MTGLGGTLDDMADTNIDEPGSLAVAPTHPRDNWVEFIAGGAAAGFTNAIGADLYNDAKAACRAAVERFRDQEPDPDEHNEYVHQLVAEAFIGRCPPGQKLVHLNGNGLDNRRVNLAYVPESDPRPPAPLNPRQGAFGATGYTGKKRHKRRGKHSA